MREAIVIHFNTGCTPLVVIGEVSKAEFGRYVAMGCSIAGYTQYNKNSIPIVPKTLRFKAADMVGGKK